MKKVRNKDIADKLGLSNTLVSLVLNNKADQHGIRKDTQEKVFAVAARLGYFEEARQKDGTSPVIERPGVMGMIVPSLNDPFVFGISPLLQKIFTEMGFAFSVVTKDPDDQRYTRLIQGFRKFYSGLILVGDAADENTVRTLRNADFPFIILEKNIKNLHLNTVNCDIHEGAEIVAGHIAALGYKKPLVISHEKPCSAESEAIEELNDSFKKRLGIANVPVLKIRSTGMDETADFLNFEKYLRPPHSTDIMVITRAELVYVIMKTLQNRKIRIPNDIALLSMEEGMGFDLIYTPVSCLRKPFDLIATKAAHMLWSEVKNSGKGKFKRQITFPEELIVRHSCH